MLTLPAAFALLSTFVGAPSSTLPTPANSEQRQPVSLGATPRELALGLAGSAVAFPSFLQELGEKQFPRVRAALGEASIELEVWPARDDDGRIVWTIARWRKKTPGQPWFWLDARGLGEIAKSGEDAPFLPGTLRSWKKTHAKQLFVDFLELDDLYGKPVAGDCVWTGEDGSELAHAWAPMDQVEQIRGETAKTKLVCHVLPQPARVGANAASFVVGVDKSGVSWPDGTRWRAPETAPASTKGRESPVVRAWPANYTESYRRDLLALDGETEAVFPISGKRMRFTRKNSADSNHQLEELADYLTERYTALGIRVKRQRFTWRGIPQSNLIAVIPGRASTGRPVLMADHYDTAFQEDAFAKHRGRVSAPGADDNVSATAGLLRAAEVLRGLELREDVWLVHLTGEEFPADDLGARVFIDSLLARKHDITGLVLMDMIGWHQAGDGVFQISAGNSPESLAIARTAADAAPALIAPGMKPKLRTRFDRRSYLYNTDGLIFSDAGFPVILFNEHLNALENISRKGYHQSTDTSAKIDFEFAASVTRVAIETAARLAR